jgi:signal transduction histidine kinase
MKQVVRWLLAVSFVIAMTGAARAQDHGTEADAKQMVQEALAHIKQVGTARAFEDFNAPGEKWLKKDIYIYCINLDGTCTCHAAKTALVGKNLIDLKTADGEAFIKNMVDLAKTKGSGWVEYRWPHPQTGKMEAKRTYIAKIPGYDGFVASGAYK